MDVTKQEGIIMSTKQWLYGGVLCGLLVTGVVRCSAVSHPSISQIAPTDHAALVTWYDKEAAQLRQKAKDMEDMRIRYLKYPALIAIEGKHAPKTDVLQHCSNLVSLYTKSAEEADGLAQMHRGMVK